MRKNVYKSDCRCMGCNEVRGFIESSSPLDWKDINFLCLECFTVLGKYYEKKFFKMIRKNKENKEAKIE